jgi:uncharacterized membrane protein YdjX (TVP38/TMEM64 family)
MTEAPERQDLSLEELEEKLLVDSEPPLLLRPKVVGGLVVGFLALVVAYWAVSRYLGIDFTFDAEPFRDWVAGFGVAGPLIYILVITLATLVAPVPNTPIFMAAGLAWGPVLGTAYSMVGVVTGSAIAFWIARRLGRRHLPRLIGARNATRIDSLLLKMGGRIVFWARMLPAISFDWLSYVAGVTAIPFRVYIIYSALGMLFPTAMQVVAGDGLGRDFRITLGATAVWVAVVVVSAGVYWQRRRRRLRARAESAG